MRSAKLRLWPMCANRVSFPVDIWRGQINIPQAELATRIDEVPKDQPVVTVCLSGARSFRSAQFLAQAGYDNVSSLAGGVSGWMKRRARGRG